MSNPTGTLKVIYNHSYTHTHTHTNVYIHYILIYTWQWWSVYVINRFFYPTVIIRS